MPFTFTMPKLSPTMEEGVIEKWHKKEGDFVEAGDLIIEVSTDKATVEHNALDGGYLRKILVEAGNFASVNAPIAIFTEEESESIDGYVVEQPAAAAPEEKTAEASGKEPQPSAADAAQPAATQAASAGGLQQPAFSPLPPLENYQFNAPREPIGERLRTSPLARKLAAEQGKDLSTVKGTGPGGRVVARDLENAQPSAAIAFSRRETPRLAPGSYEEIPMSPMRKAIGRRLQESKTFIPHYYVSQTIQADALYKTREELKNWEIKVSFNDFIVRACALALRKHPVINSGYNSVTQSVTEYQTIDVAIAVSVDGGLITPIVRHADYKNVGELSMEIKSLAKRARESKLDPEEYQGGSFTISNLGMYGITQFTAVINPPQGAILAVGGLIEKPVVKEGRVVPGKTMEMTLSSDHRVIDGAAAASFLATVKAYLENPAGLLL